MTRVIGRNYVLNLYDQVIDNEMNSRSGMVGRHMRRLAIRMVAGAKAQVGVRTGALRASIHHRQERWTRGQLVMVGSELDYAYMHHEGTRPHVIVSHTGRRLRFVSGGRVVYAQRVNHPGTRSNRYLTDQLRYVRD